MKRIIKIMCIIMVVFLSIGCGKTKSAKDAVSNYLDLYISNDEVVMKQLDEFVDREKLTNEQKNLYKEVLTREYSSIEYEIVNERYEEDCAFIETSLNVLDLNKAQNEAFKYFMSNEEEFNDVNGEYDNSKYITFKLNKMKEEKDFINYNIVFKVINNKGNWEVEQLSNEDLEKIHGIYNN